MNIILLIALLGITWILMNSTFVTVGTLVGAVVRGLLMFGWLMRAGQALFKLKNDTKFIVWKGLILILAYIWGFLMAVSAIIDIVVNVVLVTFLSGLISAIDYIRFGTDIRFDKPSSWNETYSYRLGRWCFDKEFDGTTFREIGELFRAWLKFFEGVDHVAYIYGKIPFPYPDLKTLYQLNLVA